MPEQCRFVQGGKRRVIIVGHGPSIYSGLGAVIDTMTVVRLKAGMGHRRDWGSRTDYLCARSSRYDLGMVPFWLLKDRYDAYRSDKKPTTGLCAVLEAIDRLHPESISVIGFDRLMHPERTDPPNTWLAHDKHAEHALLKSLGVEELGQIR